MNDFQMNLLAGDHRESLLAEARRERLARTARATAPSPHRPRRRRPFAGRSGTSLLFGRVVLC